MRERWTPDQIAALAPDPSSMSSARGLATATKWVERGTHDGPPGTIWGLAKGSGSKPYQTCIDLDAPAYKCSCPSRKFPCKHALGLLLLWSAGQVPEAEPAAFVTEWTAKRAATAATTQTRKSEPQTEAQVKAAAKRAAQRADRVTAGVAELGQWLDDQVASGIAGLDRAAYQHWDTPAARLVDAQAPGLARRVHALAGVAGSRAGWDARLLGELGLLRLLTQAYARLDDLPPALAETVRAHVGYTTPIEQVLAGPAVTDSWQVIAVRDEVEERLTTRRQWLLGRRTGRWALVLAFAAGGQKLTSDLVSGTEIEADLCFYPGEPVLRGAVRAKHATPVRIADPGPATSVGGALDAYATALAADPWLAAWPVLIRGTLVPGSTWHVIDDAGDALPVRTTSGDMWRLAGAAGGRPAPIAAELSPDGLLVLNAYVDAEVVAG